MPCRPPSPCGTPGCAELVHGGGRCPKHKREQQCDHDRERPNSTARGYGRRWRKASKAFLAANPLCVFCERRGRVTAATVVDHIVPHRGNARAFWNRDQWQPLCKPCHDSVKQAQEKGGAIRGADVDGIPVDPGHHWN